MIASGAMREPTVRRQDASAAGHWVAGRWGERFIDRVCRSLMASSAVSTGTLLARARQANGDGADEPLGEEP
jgi:hypothetical protein